MSEQITVTVVDKRPAVIEGNLEIIPFPDLVAGKVLSNDGSKLLWQDAGAGGGVWGTITGTLSDQTDLQQALNGKSALVHSHAIADVTGLQAALDGKAALSHTHAIADVTGLQAALDGKAALSHSHTISDVTGLQSALDGKAALSHTHGLDALILGGTAGQAVVSGGAGAATLFAPTAGRVIFAGANGVLASDGSLFWDNTNKRLGVGTTGPAGLLHLRSSAPYLLFEDTVNAGTKPVGAITVGSDSQSKSNITFWIGATTETVISAGNERFSFGEDYVYLQATTTPNLYINNTGKVGIGMTAPAAVLHLKAGTASANGAPLKFTAGTNLTTPENGAMEFDGTNLYFTVGGVRKTVVLS
jgi:hypothetical protein